MKINSTKILKKPRTINVSSIGFPVRFSNSSSEPVIAASNVINNAFSNSIFNFISSWILGFIFHKVYGNRKLQLTICIKKTCGKVVFCPDDGCP